MGKIISVSMQKGGTGKSSTAQVISAIYGSQGKRVLLVDLDQQGNTTYSSGIINPARTITDVLGADCTAQDAVIPCKYYDLLASDKYLGNVELAIPLSDQVKPHLKSLTAAGIMTIRMTLLTDVLSSIRNSYDLIVVDCPPNLGNLSYMALLASDFVLIPVEASTYGLTGLDDLMQTIQAIRDSYKRPVKVAGVLLTKYNRRTTLGSDVKEMFAEYCQDKGINLFKTTIRQSVAVQEAQILQIPLIDHKPNSTAALDYKEFCLELTKSIEDK